MKTVQLTPLAILLGGCVVHISSDADTIEFDEPISGVVTDLGAGSLIITGAQTTGALVYRDLVWSGDRPPAVSAVVEDGVLYLTSDCEVQVVCQSDHEVIVSADIWVDVQTGSGDVELRGLDQGVRVETGSGDLLIEGGMGNLDLSTGSGNIDLQASQAALLFLSTGSGHITADITAGLADADVSTGSGDVVLSVPAGSYALDISTGSGDVELSGVTDSAEALRHLQISTGSGDVEVHGE